MTRYTATKTRQHFILFIEHGLRGVVLPYLKRGYQEQGHPLTPLNNIVPDYQGFELTFSAGGSLWLGGPGPRLIGDIMSLEQGSLDALRGALAGKLSKDKHPAWVSLWSFSGRLWTWKRETAETLLELLYTKEVSDWDAEYSEGRLEANAKLKKDNTHVLIVDQMPEVKGEH